MLVSMGFCGCFYMVFWGTVPLGRRGQFSSVQFSRSVMSNSLWSHESQHARPPCPSPSPGVHSDSRPSSLWCHPAISSSVIPFSSCLQSLPTSESFPVSQVFAWSGQSTGASALASFLPRKSQGWSPSEWTGWISLQCKGLSRVFSNTTVQKHQEGVRGLEWWVWCSLPNQQEPCHKSASLELRGIWSWEFWERMCGPYCLKHHFICKNSTGRIHLLIITHPPWR